MEEVKLKLEKYSPNSFVFIEGNRNINNFYILREGQITTSRIHELIEDPDRSTLKQGDTFGVVSCLCGRARIETAKTITPVQAISIQREQFIPLIQRNTPIAMKILRSFSKKLRNFDTAITRLALKKPISENISRIKEIGDYYYNKKKYRQALYTYGRFVQLNPSDANTESAKERIKQIQDQHSITPAAESDDSFTRNYQDKSMLFCEHEPGEELFIIQKGKIQVSKIIGNQELLLAVLGPGDIIGEMAILENKPRNASATAFGDVSALVVNKENFLKMVQSKPQVVLKILTLLSERIWVAYRQLENIAIKDDYKRMLDALLIQLEKQKIELKAEVEYNTGLGPDEILKLIGAEEDKGEELITQLFSDRNFKLMDNNIFINNLNEFSKVVDSIRKFQLKSNKDISG